MPTKAIFFDVDDTLLHFTEPYNEILSAAIGRVEEDVQGEWLNRFDVTFHHLLSDCEPSPYRRALAAMDSPADSDVLASSLLEAEIDACQPPTNVHADLDRLSNNFELGVLTNGVPRWQLQKLRAFGLEEYFASFVTAYDADSHKPNIAPFEVAEQSIKADQYALVGDSDADVVGARRADWGCYHYSGDGFGEIPAALSW